MLEEKAPVRTTNERKEMAPIEEGDPKGEGKDDHAVDISTPNPATTSALNPASPASKPILSLTLVTVWSALFTDYFLMTVVIPIFNVALHGESEFRIGLLFSSKAIVQIISAPFWSLVIDRYYFSHRPSGVSPSFFRLTPMTNPRMQISLVRSRKLFISKVSTSIRIQRYLKRRKVF